MSKVIRLSEKTEERIKEYKQAVLEEEKITGHRAFYDEIQENENLLLQSALVVATHQQVKYLRERGLDIVIKKE